MVVVIFQGCTHQSQQTEVVPQVRFSGDILPILRADCAINSGCHLGSNNTNLHINFADSAAYLTILSKQLVSTSNPTASLLYVQVNTGTMPLAPYPALSQADVRLILLWIQQGAQNN